MEHQAAIRKECICSANTNMHQVSEKLHEESLVYDCTKHCPLWVHVYTYTRSRNGNELPGDRPGVRIWKLGLGAASGNQTPLCTCYI